MSLTRSTVAGALVFILFVSTAFGRERGEDDLRRDMEFARQGVYPALVNISVVVNGYGGGRSQRIPGS